MPPKPKKPAKPQGMPIYRDKRKINPPTAAEIKRMKQAEFERKKNTI